MTSTRYGSVSVILVEERRRCKYGWVFVNKRVLITFFFSKKRDETREQRGVSPSSLFVVGETLSDLQSSPVSTPDLGLDKKLEQKLRRTGVRCTSGDRRYTNRVFMSSVSREEKLRSSNSS